jgi:phage terminase large subunit
MADIYRRLLADMARSRDALVPPAFQDLFDNATWHIWYGGRASGKSWSIARVLLMQGFEQPLRILCCREIQGSIRESAYRLLKDQIRVLDLEDFYDVQADRIVGKNGTEFIFEGLRFNYSKIRSYEGINRLWLEEGQSVSARSLEELIPTVIRNTGIQCYVSFNPINIDDPVWTEFVQNPRPGSIVRKVSYKDNPFIAPELQAEREWLLATDPDAHDHIWDGNFRQASDAQILRGKYVVEDFEVSPDWAGPYFGLDYGFAADPCAAVRLHIDDSTRTLYVSAEFWKLGVEIDSLPQELEGTIPGISRHVVFADSARPESTSYLQRNGIPHVWSAEKWPGSVDDGIAYLRAFARIVIHPSCTHFVDECQRYQFRTDRLTGLPLPEPLDKHNHLIDSARYGLSPLIRNQPTGGYFSRAALLDRGEPMDPGNDRVDRVFMTAAICARPGSAVGLVYWAHSSHHGFPLQVLGFELAEIEEALSVEWLTRVFARAQELRQEYRALEPTTAILAEAGDLCDALGVVMTDELLPAFQQTPPPYDLIAIEEPDRIPATLDERAERLRATVNGGRFVKLSRSAYARRTTHRSVTANHLLNQILGFRPGVKDQATELTACFALGCLASFDSDGTAPGRRALPAPVVVAPPPEPPPTPTLLLRVGQHVIDGVLVDVRDLDGGDFVQHPMTPGRHVVDDKIAYVHPVGHGIRIPIRQGEPI